MMMAWWFFFFFQAEDGIRDADVTGVQTCALPIAHLGRAGRSARPRSRDSGSRRANSGASASRPHGRSKLARSGRARRPAVRVLVVEDEVVLAEAVARGLRREGMAVDLALDGADALEKAVVNHYEVIVLDRDLPGVHGDAVCRRLAAQGAPSRILMLTAAGAVDDRVEGLNLGADDFLGKPFAFNELVARVRALGRRTGEPTPPVLARQRLGPSTNGGIAAAFC